MSRPNIPVPPDIMHGVFRCNTGGPNSRSREQVICSSLLGAENGGIPLVVQVALDFEDFDPLETVHRILERSGVEDPQHLKRRYPSLPEPCICREFSADHPLRIRLASDEEVLSQVLWLGLSTRSYYDPSRPVLLTRASLTRQLQYFQGKGFYA